MRALLAFLLILGSATTCVAQAPLQKPDWTAWKFLMGDWASEGPSAQGNGAFSFQPELDGRILVRRNHADLPAAKERPASSHEDLQQALLALNRSPLIGRSTSVVVLSVVVPPRTHSILESGPRQAPSRAPAYRRA